MEMLISQRFLCDRPTDHDLDINKSVVVRKTLIFAPPVYSVQCTVYSVHPSDQLSRPTPGRST